MAQTVQTIQFTKKKSSVNRIPVVTYCGSLSKSKGIDLIIDAARLINNVEFVIIGGLKTELDYYKKIAINLGVNNVKFVGQVSYSKVPELLNNSDSKLSLNYLKNRFGEKVKVRTAPERAGDVKHTQADISKIHTDIGYTVQKRFWEGLEETIKWWGI